MSLRGNRMILRKDIENKVCARSTVAAYGTRFYTREFVIQKRISR